MLAAALSLAWRPRRHDLRRTDVDRVSEQLSAAARGEPCAHPHLVADAIADVYCARCGEDLTG